MFCKKIIAFVMVICLSASCGMLMNTQALETSEPNQEIFELELVGNGNVAITPFWYTADTITVLSISSTGVATGTAKITGYSGTTTKVTITMTLQKKGGFLNLFWNDVVTWTQTFNNYKGALSKNYNVSGGTYRIRADYVAYKGSASETITAYSSEVKY